MAAASYKEVSSGQARHDLKFGDGPSSSGPTPTRPNHRVLGPCTVAGSCLYLRNRFLPCKQWWWRDRDISPFG